MAKMMVGECIELTSSWQSVVDWGQAAMWGSTAPEPSTTAALHSGDVDQLEQAVCAKDEQATVLRRVLLMSKRLTQSECTQRLRDARNAPWRAINACVSRLSIGRLGLRLCGAFGWCKRFHHSAFLVSLCLLNRNEFSSFCIATYFSSDHDKSSKVNSTHTWA
jgi:hypothetical protein